MYFGMRLFFSNGGSTCWIVSVGGYWDGSVSASALIDDPLKVLAGEPEPSIILAPDAALLEIDEWSKVANAYLDHFGELISRFAILVILEGGEIRNPDAKTDIISGTETDFRSKIASKSNLYGMAYYPWVDTNVVDESAFGLVTVGPNLRKQLSQLIADEIDTDAKPDSPAEARNKDIQALAQAIDEGDPVKSKESH